MMDTDCTIRCKPSYNTIPSTTATYFLICAELFCRRGFNMHIRFDPTQIRYILLCNITMPRYDKLGSDIIGCPYLIPVTMGAIDGTGDANHSGEHGATPGVL
jgi:hypothetical protein